VLIARACSDKAIACTLRIFRRQVYGIVCFVQASVVTAVIFIVTLLSLSLASLSCPHNTTPNELCVEPEAVDESNQARTWLNIG
jgi:hypothetical protein